MKLTAFRALGVCAALVVALGACSGSAAPGDTTGSGGSQAVSPCGASADLVIEQFESFLEPHADLTPEEFLSQPELEGLDEFQLGVSELVADPNDGCSTPALEEAVNEALGSFAQGGLLEQYLVGAVRTGVVVTSRDVVVEPGDDLAALLPLLGDGSSVTFGAGEFTLDASVLVQSDLTLVGAGRDQTVLRSSADTAAVAVLDGGRLTVADLSVEHVGELPASVILVVDASLELSNSGIAGGVANEAGEGGSGVILSRAEWQAAESPSIEDAPSERVVINASVISNNASAGIAVTADYAPTVADSTVSDNGLCGVCFFDAGAGSMQSTVVENNGVGVQLSGQSRPELTTISFVNNAVAGVLAEDTSTPTINQSTFQAEEAVGVDVQNEAAPTISTNDFGPHAVAISVRDSSLATVTGNTITGGDVALLVAGSSAPLVEDNRIVESLVSSVLHTDTSAGTFERNVLGSVGAAGAVIEGSATPRYIDVAIDGGLVGMVFREQANGQVEQSIFSNQDVGIEIADDATLALSDSTFSGHSAAAVLVSGDAGGSIANSEFAMTAQIAIQLGGSGETSAIGNVISGGETGILVTGSSSAGVSQNELDGQNFGIVIGAQAAPAIEDNKIAGSETGAIFFGDDSSGAARNNEIVDAQLVGIRVSGQSDPTITSNTIFAAVGGDTAEAGDGEVATEEGEDDPDAPSATSAAGLLYGDSAGGEAGLNQIFGFVIGVQIADDAAPNLLTNRADGAGVGGVGFLYNDRAAGRAEGNLSVNLQLGFQVSGQAAPSLIANTVEGSTVAAFLVQSEAVAVLDENECPGAPVGIAVLDEAAPELGADNLCPVSG